MPDTKLSALTVAFPLPLQAADQIYVVQGGNSRRATVGDLPLNASVQFQDEGSNLGAAGTVNTLDFTGAGVSAARVGDAVTVTISGGGGGSPPTGTGFPHITAGVQDAAAIPLVRTLTVVLDGQGEVLVAGLKADVTIPFAGTITGWRILEISDTPISGSAEIDVWKDIYANFPPTVVDTITALAKPTLTIAIKAESSTLTGWTTAIAAGDTLRFNLDSVTSCKKLLLQLIINHTG